MGIKYQERYYTGYIDMSAGFEVRNNNNVIVINEQYKNIVLDKKIKIKDLPYTQNSEFFTINHHRRLHPEGGVVGTYNNKSRDWEILLDEDTLFFAISVHEGFNWYTFQSSPEMGNRKFIFRVPDIVYNKMDNVYMYTFKEKTTKTSTYGLQIFNDKSECVFDSNEKYAKVVQYSPYKLNAPFYLNYAIAINPFFFVYSEDGDKRVRSGTYSFDYNESEGTVCVTSFIHEGLTETSVYFSSFPMMLLDVTWL